MTEFFTTILIFLSGLFGGAADVQQPQTFGAFSDPFLSLQVGTSPTNGDFLTTNGTDSTWTDCTTLLGAGLCDGSDDGGGGGGGGTWATTTSTVAGQLINYPLNDDDVVTIGSNSTTTAEFYFDPNLLVMNLGTGAAGDSSLTFGPNTSNQWIMGWDDTDKSFAIASSTVLGTLNALTIDKNLKLTVTNASSTLFSTTYASSTKYYGANLANCNTENMLTWTDGVFGCESDSSGGASNYDAWTHPQAGTSATTSGLIVTAASSTFTQQISAANATTTLLTATTAWLTNLFIGADTLAEYIADTAGAMFTGNTETDITVTYDDADNTTDFVVDTLPNLTGTLDVDSGGTGVATFSSSQLLYGNGTAALSSVATTAVSCTGNISCTAFTGLGSASSISFTGDLPFANLTQVSANSVLGNVTGATADGASVATSSLFTGTSGQVLGRVGSTWAGVATTTFSTGVTYLNGNVTCDTASAAVFGCLTSANWSTFNSKLGSYDAWTHPQAGTSATTSRILVSTTTGSIAELIVASSSGSQLALSDQAGVMQWTMRNAGGKLFFSTTTVAGTATSSPAAVEINGNAGSSGLYVGTSTPGATGLAVNGTAFLHGLTQATGGTNNDLCISGTPNQLIEETTGVCVVSSRKFKHDIVALDLSALDTVMALKPVEFSPNDNASFDYKDRQYGFVAEEVAEADPHLAKYGIDSEPRTLDDWAILSVVTKAVQEIWHKVMSHESRIDKLEKENAELKARLHAAGI